MTKFVHGCEYQVHSVLNAWPEKYYLVSGLLVTGRSGSGKTSIVRAVAKSLQEDPRTFTCAHQTRSIHIVLISLQIYITLIVLNFRSNL